MGNGFRAALFGSAMVLSWATTAQAALVISTAATSGVTCTAGICKATAASATLNVKDLTTLLGAGNVKVVAAKAQADIEIGTAVIWASAHVLTLDAYHSISFTAPVTSEGTASGVRLLTNDGGSGGDYSFSGTGSLALWDPNSILNINSQSYTLCKDIAVLAQRIAAKPAGRFALSRAYNAATDGTYAAAPIPTVFTGSFEGLGNKISNLAITDTNTQHMVGLFAQTNGAQLRDVVFFKANVKGGTSSDVGMLVGYAVGSTIQRSTAAGQVSASDDSMVGGLVGYNNAGTIAFSASSATVTDTGGGTQTGTLDIGGLLGLNMDGAVQDSFATGKVTGGAITEVGGLVGFNGTDTGTASVLRSYATGNVSGGNDADVGGLVGADISSSGTGLTITSSYATGTATGATSVSGGLTTGGLLGYSSGSAISLSYATGTATGVTGWFGGLSGFIDLSSSISNSFSTGAVTTGAASYGGGLSGWSGGSVTDSYALGGVTGADSSIIGGLLGQNATNGTVNQAYAIGPVQATGGGVTAGGFIGFNNDATANTLLASYFDTQTTKQSVGVGGGTTAGPLGRTTAMLKANLPAGFDTAVWSQKAAVNTGFPFLTKNRPPTPPPAAPAPASRASAGLTGHPVATLHRPHLRLRGASPFPILNVRAAASF